MQTIGANIRQKRKLAGITQEQLASLSGISVMSIRRYESDARVPTLEMLGTIANVLSSVASELVPPDQWKAITAIDAPNAEVNIQKKALDDAFSKLNEAGQRIAVERLLELAKIPDYQMKPDAK